MKRLSHCSLGALCAASGSHGTAFFSAARRASATAEMNESPRKTFETEASTQRADEEHPSDGKAGGEQGSNQQQQQQQQRKTDSTALGAATEEPKRRNIVVLSNTTKAVYIHPTNHIASWYWFITDFHKWFVGFVFLFVGSQVLARYRVAKVQTAAQAQLGENLLDQRTRDLLNDIEVLRKKDPIRLEHEANVYHEQFWKRRALAVSESRTELRKMEMEKGKMQGIARGTDMTEWLGAKAKDDEEREVARRTQDYIQGFHQHLKSKRLI